MKEKAVPRSNGHENKRGIVFFKHLSTTCITTPQTCRIFLFDEKINHLTSSLNPHPDILILNFLLYCPIPA